MSLNGSQYLTLGSLNAQFGQLTQAMSYYRQALHHFRQENDGVNIGRMLNRLGELHALRGDLRKARTYCQTAARIFRKENEIAGAINAIRNVAMVHYQTQRPQLAIRLLEQALSDCIAIGDTFSEAVTLTCIAQIYCSREKYLFV